MKKISMEASLCVLILAGLAGIGPAPAAAQGSPRKTVSSEADLPRFSYPVPGTASDLLQTDDAIFGAFTRKVGADVNSVLSGYVITDKATLRGLLGTKSQVQSLTGDTEGALATLAQLRDLQEKPDARAMSGLYRRALLTAIKETHATSGPAFENAFAREFKSAVDALPWETVQDRVKELKTSCQITTHALVLSNLKVNIDPQTVKTKSIDFEAAKTLVFLPGNREILHAAQGRHGRNPDCLHTGA